MLGIKKLASMGPKWHNHSIPKTTLSPSIRKKYRGMVKIKFWRDISTKGDSPSKS